MARLATYSYIEAKETLPSPRADRKLAIGASGGNSSSLDADDNFVWITQAVRVIDRDKGCLAGETIVPSLEAVLGVCVQRKGDRPVVEDVSDLVQGRDCKRATIKEVAVGA